jgi:hypothetical protein
LHDKANLGCCLVGRGGDLPAPKDWCWAGKAAHAITLESKLLQTNAMPRRTGNKHSTRPHRAAISCETNHNVVEGVCICRCCSLGIAACALGNPHKRPPTRATLSSPSLLKAQLKHECQAACCFAQQAGTARCQKFPWKGREDCKGRSSSAGNVCHKMIGSMTYK